MRSLRRAASSKFSSAAAWRIFFSSSFESFRSSASLMDSGSFFQVLSSSMTAFVMVITSRTAF